MRVEAVASALTAAPLLLRAITDIAKFFKKDRTIQKATVDISDNALGAAMARSLKDHQCAKVRHPRIRQSGFDRKPDR